MSDKEIIICLVIMFYIGYAVGRHQTIKFMTEWIEKHTIQKEDSDD